MKISPSSQQRMQPNAHSGRQAVADRSARGRRRDEPAPTHCTRHRYCRACAADIGIGSEKELPEGDARQLSRFVAQCDAEEERDNMHGEYCCRDEGRRRSGRYQFGDACGCANAGEEEAAEEE